MFGFDDSTYFINLVNLLTYSCQNDMFIHQLFYPLNHINLLLLYIKKLYKLKMYKYFINLKLNSK